MRDTDEWIARCVARVLALDPIIKADEARALGQPTSRALERWRLMKPEAAAEQLYTPIATRESLAMSEDDVRVLVVDDFVDAAEALAETLTISGYKVWVATDGAARARRSSRTHQPHCVLLDIGMPGWTATS